jgi:uncharacterized protein CbrC (UPF0167 family)
MTLPSFAYHPDPLATGSIVESDAECEACGQERGYRYTGPVYAEDDIEDLCPWCIADGSAADRFDATFTDLDDDLPDDAADTIAKRTPGFSGWQQEVWLSHCGDGAAFLGRVGAAELAAYPDAVADIRLGLGHRDGADHFLAALDKDGEPTAYLFRCRVCGTHLAYTDSA